MKQRANLSALLRTVKRTDLADFMTKEAGVDFTRSGDRYTCLCPMPFHRDSAPSFNVSKLDDGVWLFHCFGCGSEGTIIDFCMDYWSLDSLSDALVMLLEKLAIKDNQELLIKAVKDAKIERDISKKLDGEHFIACKRCYGLLRQHPGDKEVEKWVAGAYWKMNRMLSDDDIKGIELISDRAGIITNDRDKVGSYLAEDKQ